jgi:hypothetical protein
MMKSRLLIVLTMLMGAACANPPAPQQPASVPALDPASAAALMQPIHTLIGDARCDNDTQCHSIGVGHKACGGPAGFMAWSSLVTDEQALRRAVDRQAQAQRVEDERKGMLSNCLALRDPGARCVASSNGVRRCQLNVGAASAQ